MSTTTELKPCPFCGGQPTWIHHSNYFDGSRLMSLGCCEFRRAGKEADLIAAWNRRSAAQGEPSKEALSVTRILLDVVPGEDGMGHEVYAKSVKEVEDLLSKQARRIEELETQLGVESAGSAEQVSEKEAFEKWAEQRGVWPRLTHEEIFKAGYSAALQHTAPAPSNPAMEGAIMDALAHGTGIVRIDPWSIYQQSEQAAPSKAGEWTDEQADILRRAAEILEYDCNRPHNAKELRALLSSAPAQTAQSEDARDAVLAEAKNTILWLLRRLPKGYDEPPHVLRAISAIDAAMSTPSEKEPK